MRYFSQTRLSYSKPGKRLLLLESQALHIGIHHNNTHLPVVNENAVEGGNIESRSKDRCTSAATAQSKAVGEIGPKLPLTRHWFIMVMLQ